MSYNFYSVQAQPFSLAGGGATLGDTSLTLKSFTGINGELLTMADFDVIGFGTISPGSGTLEESISFTGVTQNANGTATLTGIKNVSFKTPYTQTSGLSKTHAGSTTFIISNTTGFYSKIYSDLTPYKYWALPVANYASLPTGTEDGEARVTLDDSKVYVWDSGTTTWNLAGAGGGAGTVYVTTKMGTQSQGGDFKTFTLTSGSFPSNNYLQVFVNGFLMEYGASADYLTSGGNAAVFNSVVLATDKITLLVVSVDIVNPNWNGMNADLLPITDNFYNIGDLTHRIKNFFLYNTYSGTPTSTTNKVVDQTSVAEAKTASKIPVRDVNSDILVATTPTAGDAAASKTYVDSFGKFKSGILASVYVAGSAVTTTISLGFQPKRIQIFANCGTSSQSSNSSGVWDSTTNVNHCSYTVTSGSGGGTGFTWLVNAVNNAYSNTGVVNNITSTGFDIVSTVNNVNANATLVWTAEN